MFPIKVAENEEATKYNDNVCHWDEHRSHDEDDGKKRGDVFVLAK